MDKKMIYIVVAVLVVVIVVGVAGVMLLNQGGNGGTTPTPTPEPVAVSEASSIQFIVNETNDKTDAVVVYQFAVKDLNTANETLRVDMDLGEDGKFSYIVDTGAQKSWVTMDDGATWSESDFATDCTTYGTLFHDFLDKLIADGDDANDLSYTTDTTSIAISCVEINPTLEDSLFTTS